MDERGDSRECCDDAQGKGEERDAEGIVFVHKI
jgi:hypothetical protein